MVLKPRSLPGAVSKKERQRFKSAKGMLFPRKPQKQKRMRVIPLPKDFVSWNAKSIANGERAMVSIIRQPKSHTHGLVARIPRWEPKRKEKPTELMFHELTLARQLFPQNFMQVVGVSPGQRVIHGPALLSAKVKLSSRSLRVLNNFYDKKTNSARMNTIMHDPEYQKHEEMVQRIAKPIAKKMAESGIIVNTNPANVWFTTKGIPVFFDITTVNLEILLKRLGRRANRESVKYLQNHENEELWHFSTKPKK